MAQNIFQYPIDDRVFFRDPVDVYRKLWEAIPDLGKSTAKYNAAIEKLKQMDADPTIPAHERLEAEEDIEDVEDLFVSGFRFAFGHPLPDSVSAAEADKVFLVDYATCLKTLIDFFVWTEKKSPNSGSKPTSPTGTESTL